MPLHGGFSFVTYGKFSVELHQRARGSGLVTRDDLEAFRHVPFLFWVKDEDWRYLWGNDAIRALAGEDVVGKRDADLVWKDNAQALVDHDKGVFESGKPCFSHETVDRSEQGKATLSVCKWVDELDGRRLVFGTSFVVER